MGWSYIQDQSAVQAILPDLMVRRSWGVDCETTGLDALRDRPTLLQIGDRETQYLIDMRKTSIEPLRPFFESEEHYKILHNAKFDYKMLKASTGIEIERMRDTYLAAKILDMGRKFKGFGLADCLEARLQIIVDKALQKSFIGHQGDFSEAQLAYAATDVKHLLPLNADYSKALRAEGLAETYILECEAIPCFGDMELAGLYLNKEAWMEIVKEHQEAANETAAMLDDFARQFYREDIFGSVEINYGSPPQMLELFRKLGVRLKQVDHKTGAVSFLELEDTSDGTLKQITDVPAVKLLKKWRKHMKIVTTYGQPFIDAIHPITGKIHPIFDQLGTETGRPASASDSPVNMLNIPRDRRMRNCFIAPDDYLIETHDYSGCELRILAHLSRDPNLVVPLQRGEDLHCSVATQLYGKEVTKKNENKHLRTPAKNLNFGIAYGMGARKLCVDLNAQDFPITFEEAKGLYKKYCDTYHVAVDYLRNCGREAALQGFAVNPNGRRRNWLLPNPNDRERFPKGKWDQRFKAAIAAIEREGGNYPIQATNADITKYGMVKIRRHIKKNRIRSVMVLQVYDEIVTRTHKDDSQQFMIDKVRIMNEAARRWITSVPIEIEGEALPYWTK